LIAFDPWLLASGAVVGVGQLAADEERSSESIPDAPTAPRATFAPQAGVVDEVGPRLGSPSRAVTVGQDEDALASVRRAHVGCSEKVVGVPIPEVGKVAEDQSQTSGNKTPDVLQDDELGLDRSQSLGNERPEPSVVVDAEALPGARDGLTGEARHDAIHRATPRSAVEGGEVSPDRRRSQGAVRHARRQDAGREGFPLHVTDGAGGGQGESDAEVEAADAGTEGQHTHGGGRTIHTYAPAPTTALRSLMPAAPPDRPPATRAPDWRGRVWWRVPHRALDGSWRLRELRDPLPDTWREAWHGDGPTRPATGYLIWRRRGDPADPTAAWYAAEVERER
jgi:hypothetical protein